MSPSQIEKVALLCFSIWFQILILILATTRERAIRQTLKFEVLSGTKSTQNRGKCSIEIEVSEES